MESLWGSIDVDRWQQVACLRGRVAGEQDVKDGRAVFYLQGDEPAAYVDIDLPHCAVLSMDGQCIPIVIIQSERTDRGHFLGYRPINGGHGICLLSDVQLLDKPDKRFYR